MEQASWNMENYLWLFFLKCFVSLMYFFQTCISVFTNILLSFEENGFGFAIEAWESKWDDSFDFIVLRVCSTTLLFVMKSW